MLNLYQISIFIVLAAAGAFVVDFVRRKLTERREPDTCKNCVHFDLEEGQAQLRMHPHFMQAADVIPPSLMGAGVDAQGNKKRNVGIPAKATWADMGACMNDADHKEKAIRYCGDKCEFHCRRRAG